MPSRSFLRMGLVALLGLGFAAGLAASPGTGLIDRVVADVDGEVLTARDLSFWLWQERLRRPETERLPDSALAPEVLRLLTDEMLLARWAAEVRHELDEEDLERATERHLETFRLLAPTRSGFDSWLGEAGFDIPTLRRHLRERERRIRLIRTALTLRYDIRPERLDGTERLTDPAAEPPVRVRLRHIQLRCPTWADDAETSGVRLRALALRREILRGTPFTEAAKLHSEDPATRGLGGDLDWMETSALRPNLREAAVSLQPGEVSQPVRTDRGWHLFQLVESETAAGQALTERVRAIYDSVLDELRRERSVRLAEGYSLAPPRREGAIREPDSP